MRRCLTAMLLCFWSFSHLIGPSALAQDSGKPNIVLCMADDQGWGDVGYRGTSPVKTPVMDEMAASGLRFDRFYAAAPVCSPTRGSVLTGRHPNRFGCFSWGHTLRPQEVTIAEALKTAGYTTGHFGKWHLGPVRADSTVCPGASGFDEWFSSPNFFDNNPLMSHNGKAVQTTGESSQVTVDAAIDFIRDCAKKDKRFLAVVWFGSPHSPHQAAEEFREMYADQPKKLRDFLGEVTGIDTALGNLRSELRRLKIAENTLLWYCSDNGALKQGSTGGLSGGKGNLLEGGLRVPAMIEWPACIKTPRISNILSGTVDIYPTLLDIAGVKMAEQPPLDGVSLVPLIKDRMTQRDKGLGFWVYPERGIPKRSTEIVQQMMDEQSGKKPASPPPPDPGQITKQYQENEFPGPAAWIDGDYKLLCKVAKSGATSWSLFDLSKDAQEKTDLADQDPDRVQKMRTDLEAWQTAVIRSLNGKDYTK